LQKTQIKQKLFAKIAFLAKITFQEYLFLCTAQKFKNARHKAVSSALNAGVGLLKQNK
jgi:hypothetical protein